MRTHETLLTTRQVYERLGVSRETFRRILPSLMASGLQTVRICGPNGKRPFVRYRAATLDRAIEKAAVRGIVIGE